MALSKETIIEVITGVATAILAFVVISVGVMFVVRESEKDTRAYIEERINIQNEATEYAIQKSRFASWKDTTAKVKLSVRQMTSNDAMGKPYNYCTAFSINEEKAYWMSAYHCLGDYNFIDGQIAWNVYENKTMDLVIFMAPGISAPALLPRTELTLEGEPAATYGHAHGYVTAQFRTGFISASHIMSEEISKAYPDFKTLIDDGQELVLLDQGVYGGTSGGPVIDLDGNVIGVAQAGTPNEGGETISRTMRKIHEATKQFWGIQTLIVNYLFDGGVVVIE